MAKAKEAKKQECAVKRAQFLDNAKPSLYDAEIEFRKESLRLRNHQPCGGGFRLIRKKLEG